MWETNTEKMEVKVFWFYHPEETASDFTNDLPYPVSTTIIFFFHGHLVNCLLGNGAKIIEKIKKIKTLFFFIFWK